MNSLEEISIFERITMLVQDISITEERGLQNDIDDQCYPMYTPEGILESLGHLSATISFREIIVMLTKYLQDDCHDDILHDIFKELRVYGATYPYQYPLFDFCLAALSDDFTDAILHLDNARNLLGISDNLWMILMCFRNEQIVHDRDMRKFLATLAASIVPISAHCHTDRYGKEYEKRFEIYRKELELLRLEEIKQ